MLDPVAKDIQSYYPEPNLAGQWSTASATNNYNYLAPGNSPKRKYFGRFDADVTSNNRITGSAAWNDGPSRPFSPVAPINLHPGDVMNMSGQLSDYWTISPNLINEFRIGFMGEYDIFTPRHTRPGLPAEAGPSVLARQTFSRPSPSTTITAWRRVALEYQLQGEHVRYFRSGDAHQRTPPPPLRRRRDHLPRRFHRLGQSRMAPMLALPASTPPAAIPVLSPPIPVRRMPTSCLGYVQNWSALDSPEYGGRLKNPGVFVQDDFKVTPKLTLNLGLRWEGNTGWSEVNGNVRSFDPNVINPATGKPGAMWYGTTAANGRQPFRSRCGTTGCRDSVLLTCSAPRRRSAAVSGMYTFPWNVDTLWRRVGPGDPQPAAIETDSTGNVSARGDPLFRRKYQLPGVEGQGDQRDLRP